MVESEIPQLDENAAIESGTQLPLPIGDKERAIAFFWQSDAANQIYCTWNQIMPEALETLKPILSSLTDKQLKQWKDETAKTNKDYLVIRNCFNTLTGPVFEHLAFSYLKNSAQGTNLQYHQIGDSFDQIVAILKTSTTLHIEERTIRDNTRVNIKSTRISWHGRFLIIPDGLCIEKDPQQKPTVVGLVESKTTVTFTDFGDRAESLWLFMEFLRDNPQSFAQIEKILGLTELQISDDKKFDHQLIYLNRISKRFESIANNNGIHLTQAPFDSRELDDITVLLIRNLLLEESKV